jgi:metallo-beta-lactamase class B
MVRKFIISALLLLALLPAKEGYGQMTKVNNDIYMFHLKDSVFIHTTFTNIESYGRVSANGLVMIKNGSALMIDTPWNNELTEQLYNYLRDSLNCSVKNLIIGHYHEDCMGGIDFLKTKGVNTISGKETKKRCIEHKLTVADKTFAKQLKLNFENTDIICNYFGAGHTSDNIVVYIPEKKILFGGCLIKSKRSNNLGSITDAVIDEWDKTVEIVKAKYGNAEVIIPGHGRAGDNTLLDHTINLVKSYREKVNNPVK